MKNFERLDFNSWTVFIDTFVSPAHGNAHQHEDILGYSIFRGSRPVILSAGRLSYDDGGEYTRANYRCGFFDPSWPLRPKPRFFFSRALLTQTQLKQQLTPDLAVFEAENTLLGLRKTWSAKNDGGLQVSEEISSRKHAITPLLYHIFSDEAVVQQDAHTLCHTTTQTRIAYTGAQKITLEPIMRATGYGAPAACIRAVITPADSYISWTMAP